MLLENSASSLETLHVIKFWNLLFYFCIKIRLACVTSKLRKNGFREREKGVEKDGAWKDSQTLVSQVFAWKQTPASRKHPFFLLPASEYGSTSREDAMTPVSLRAVRSSVRISSQGKIPLTREWTTCEL